jgi:hypothetical protein
MVVLPRKFGRLSMILGALAILVAVALVGLYVALRHEPAFYRRALETDKVVLEKGSDRMLQKIAAMQNDFTRPGRWQFVVTADEINGWLAVDLVKNHPNALPAALRDPRVSISPSDLTIGCRYEQGVMGGILSMTVRPTVTEANVVALRIVRARAGALPAPLKQVLDGVSRAAGSMQLRLDWRHTGSDPVAMLSVPDDPDADRVVRIERLELADGEMRIAGVTERRRK